MGYHGDVLDACGLFNIDCSTIAVVAVSGDGPNVCGHLLLYTGPEGAGHYFHVAEFHGHPRYMSEAGYHRYLRESGKTEIRRRYLTLPRPNGARLYLENLMSQSWTWLVLPNNCVAFVEEVIRAGGGDWSSYSNCPDLATQEAVSTRVERFMGQLESEIYRMYGVPRF